jgi:hypothetical protein
MLRLNNYGPSSNVNSLIWGAASSSRDVRSMGQEYITYFYLMLDVRFQKLAILSDLSRCLKRVISESVIHMIFASNPHSSFDNLHPCSPSNVVLFVFVSRCIKFPTDNRKVQLFQVCDKYNKQTCEIFTNAIPFDRTSVYSKVFLKCPGSSISTVQ